MPQRIVIVGGGFSGTVLAASLLRRLPSDAPAEVVLIERSPVMGRGVAYAVRDWPYLLNVPAGRLSVDSKEPLQFLRFAQRTLPDADAEDFLPRELYGDYLQEVLSRAERDAPAQVRFTRIVGEVWRISPCAADAAFELEVAGRDSVLADRVVLAVGNPPPATMPWARAVRDHPGYRADPWALPRRLGPEQAVVILGSGLTMADVVTSLGDDAERAPRMVSISRHGLLPLPQSKFGAPALQSDGLELARAGTIRELLAASRALVGKGDELGGDWREVVTLIRHLAPQRWRRLPEVERRRFVRHLRSYWDVHRHRLPPQMASRLDALRRSGHLEVNAGRIVAMQADADRLRVTWRRRGSAVLRTLVADVVVNAIGPDYSVRRSENSLLKSLRDAKLISEDALELGLRTTLNGVCVAADGTANHPLYYLGPMLRADHWEATAAAELRDHAERMAQHMAAGSEP